ncbi:MAG: hypothetical protein NVS4B11_39310 [Ktedonobacteraceae bacterium]
MSFVISRWPQTIIFFILALLTLLAITFVLLSTFAHIDVLHMIGDLPDVISRWP